MPPRRRPDIGEAELEVLAVLWDHGPATVRRVLEILAERRRRIAYTTVLTMLSRLERKGYVASDKSGPAYVYRAAVSRDRLVRDRVRGLVDTVYDGAAGALVLHLMQSERFTRDEIEALQRLLDGLDAPED